MASPKKYAGTMESWYKTWCPYCETSNWHCNGNESDLSGLDVEAIKCRHCNNVFLLGPPDEILDELRGEDYDYITEDGVEMIRTRTMMRVFKNDEKLDKIHDLIFDELRRATEKFGSFHNTHEGYAVLLEEVDELWDDIKANNLYSSCDEAIQVAAMAMRYLFDLMPDDFVAAKDEDKVFRDGKG